VSFIALAAIVLIGLPHGAFDGAVGLALGYGKNFKSMAAFILIYIGIAASVVVFWINFPNAALLLFLAISIWHFGIGDSQQGERLQRFVQALAHGGLVVIGISILHTSEVDLIFAQLVNGETEFLWRFINVGAVAFTLIWAAYLFLAWQKPKLRSRFAELIGLAVVYYVLPPLAAFSLYFCAVHSARHLRYTWGRLRLLSYSPRLLIPLALFFTFASWGAAILMFWLMPTTETIRGPILQIIFIGLAALTVPHMLLVDGLFRRAH
jgi:Brp/Blh family beta-carotene 15,15'-monooxygenase